MGMCVCKQMLMAQPPWNCQTSGSGILLMSSSIRWVLVCRIKNCHEWLTELWYHLPVLLGFRCGMVPRLIVQVPHIQSLCSRSWMKRTPDWNVKTALSPAVPVLQSVPLQDGQKVRGGNRVPEEQPEDLERPQCPQRSPLPRGQEQHQLSARGLHQWR